MTPDLDSCLDAYRAQRLQGVERRQARTHLFSRISRDRLPTDVSWGEIRERLDVIEEEIAEEVNTHPDPAA